MGGKGEEEEEDFFFVLVFIFCLGGGGGWGGMGAYVVSSLINHANVMKCCKTWNVNWGT